MSKSRKDRHLWKRKERRRAGSADPPKIKLHRERYLARIGGRGRNPSDSGTGLFQIRLRYKEDGRTEVVVSGEVVGEVEWTVHDPSEVHHLLREAVGDFPREGAAEKLLRHVRRARATKKPCHYETPERVCESPLQCPFRQWCAEAGIPECTK